MLEMIIMMSGIMLIGMILGMLLVLRMMMGMLFPNHDRARLMMGVMLGMLGITLATQLC